MKKTFMGVKLRKLRAERNLSQIALAHTLGLSPSYLNQLEQNQRPLTVSVLLKLHRSLGVDIQQFSEDEEARLVAGLREALADAPEAIALPELQEVAAQMPALGAAVVALYRRHLDTMERLEALSLQLGDDRSDERAHAKGPAAMPFEVVRDFFFSHQNYFDAVDRAAEDLAMQAQAQGGPLVDWLVQRLEREHQVQVQQVQSAGASKRQFDPASRLLQLSPTLAPAQQAFQLATQLALLEIGPQLDSLIRVPALAGDPAAQRLARLGLANYFAGALLQGHLRSQEEPEKTSAVVILRSATKRLAVHVDEVLGNQEVVVKNLGPQLARLPGLAGMSVLASGAIVLIYNPVALYTVYGQQIADRIAEAAVRPEVAKAPVRELAEQVVQTPLVLVVDDSITVRRVTQRLLQREGYRVALAADGLQALDRLREERPVMVLSDIEMPRMDGFELVREIRADAAMKDLPVVMITSRIADKHREHAASLGVDHYLGKPYADEVLLSLVRQCVLDNEIKAADAGPLH